MAAYKASNGKVISTDKMEEVLDLEHEGCYGTIDCRLYRTRKSHQWYLVSESSWAGEASCRCAEAIGLQEAAAYVMEHDSDSIADYPELVPYISEVVDE